MVQIAESLSKPEAQKLVLLSQQLPSIKQSGKAINATLAAIEHLGYIQIDTISVVQRAHHHTLWSRNSCYQNTHLDQLIVDKKVFEYWSHAAAYLPMRDFRFSMVRKHAMATGKQNHWYERDQKLMNEILKRISIEGPLMAKDFEHTGKKKMDWSSKPAKRALENLYMQGDLMIPYRNNFHKVYDLTERVLPEGLDVSVPTEEEYIRHLITRYLQVNGLGQASEISYLRKNTRPLANKYLQEMFLGGELIKLKVGENHYFALSDSLDLLTKPLVRAKAKILSPFDNFIIQRKRLKALFDFDYQIECYVPAAKRQYGYFSLPILWNGMLVARMDCKVDRKKSILHINHLALEANLKKLDLFALALVSELKAFMTFNDCKDIEIHKTTPGNIISIVNDNFNLD
ncbi:winged helix-turn-helix domain-containing protein [Ancylomarina longa]|uniref:Winged helix-turn-helix domain-containing protein n=1 Tax=Ancylomarina longa TaxID=2487017 RepID=A0A434AW70_9BACT|nr:crosslink repair DNA glycosylase YcaQ family protein [Ancylomarina longa]RUT78761.1 winged helix-turn-helix domain-containing protein [Ancylomarina longa]